MSLLLLCKNVVVLLLFNYINPSRDKHLKNIYLLFLIILTYLAFYISFGRCLP